MTSYRRTTRRLGGIDVNKQISLYCARWSHGGGWYASRWSFMRSHARMYLMRHVQVVKVISSKLIPDYSDVSRDMP